MFFCLGLLARHLVEMVLTINNKANLSLLSILIVLLVEGFITISVEILSLRQLLPFVGNSVVVTSLIIGCFLLFLAIGYYIGGLRSHQHVEALVTNFMVTAVLVGVGLSYSFCSVFFYLSYVYLSHNILLILTVYLLLVIAPITCLLGQTLPITTNFFNQHNLASTISSQALFLSTIGSFLGSVITSLVLLSFWGVAATVVINVLLLAGLCLFLTIKKPQRLIAKAAFVLFAVYPLFTLNVLKEKAFFNLTNQYGNYRIVSFRQDDRAEKQFIANHAVMSTIDDKKQGAEYIEYIKDLLFNKLKIKDKDILVVGAGGFSLSHEKTAQNRFTYLDIDKQLKPLAEQLFLKAPIRGQFINEDARTYMHQKQPQFDVIISDTYKSYDIPSSLLTVEYFSQLKKRLRVGGYAIFNLIIDPFYNDLYSQRIDNTVSAVFKHCLKQPINYQQVANVIYVCKSDNDNTDIYSDDLNAATLDQFSLLGRAFF